MREKYEMKYVCNKCDAYLTANQVFHRVGVCPTCGAVNKASWVDSSVVSVLRKPSMWMRFVAWWKQADREARGGEGKG